MTSTSLLLMKFAYEHTPQSNTPDAPETEVIAAEIIPPVQLSAVAVRSIFLISVSTNSCGRSSSAICSFSKSSKNSDAFM